jgi:ribonuclease P protein component
LQDAAQKAATASLASDEKRQRWPRACRLVHRRQFDAVYRQGQRRACPPFVVFYRRNGLDFSRFGMSVRKALGGAVVRNRLRRRVREVLRKHREEIFAGWDIVIQPREPAVKATFALLSADLLRLLAKITSAPTNSRPLGKTTPAPANPRPG